MAPPPTPSTSRGQTLIDDDDDILEFLATIESDFEISDEENSEQSDNDSNDAEQDEQDSEEDCIPAPKRSKPAMSWTASTTSFVPTLFPFDDSSSGIQGTTGV